MRQVVVLQCTCSVKCAKMVVQPNATSQCVKSGVGWPTQIPCGLATHLLGHLNLSNFL